jgi:hypothetical protein
MANPLDQQQAEVANQFASLASPFDAGSDPYSSWFSETERNQRSSDGYTPDLFSPASMGMTSEELTAAAAKRDADNAAAIASIPPEQLARLEGMDLSGLGNGIMGGKPLNVGTFARENYYNDTTAYNPLGTAPEDMVAFDDLNSSEALAAKSSREAELSESLQSWTDPLKSLAESDPTKFGEEYSALPLTGQLAYLRNEFDNGEMGEREYQDAFADQWNASGNAGTLQFIDKYGWRMYAPDAIAQQGGQDPNGPMDWYETEGLFDGSIDRLDQFTPRVKETFDPTSAGRGLLASPVLRAAAAAMTGGVSEGVIAAGKGLTGDTLHGSDWLSIAVTGLTATGAIKPPIEGADTIGLGQAGPTLQTGGTGLFGTTYGQTMGALGAAAAGDVEGAAVSLVGGQLVKGGLDKIGLDKAALAKAGIQYDDFTAGVTKAVTEVVQGKDLDDALVSGLGKYITEGGTLDIPLGGLEDVIRDIVRPIGEVGTALGQFVKDAVPDINSIDSSRITDALKEVGAFVEDEFTQPVGGFLSDSDTTVRQGLAEFDKKIQPFTKPVGDAIEDVGQVAGDAFSALDTAVRQALPDINGPDIDLPSFDLNIPNFNPAFGTTQLNYSAPSSTRTTDSLFKDELFQFQTEIGVDLEPTEYVDLGFSDPFQDQTLLQRYPF